MGFGYPVKNSAHKVIGVIGVIQNLDYTQHMFERLNLPPGSSFSLTDHQGIYLIRNLKEPVSQKLIGTRDARQDLLTKMIKGPDEGTDEDVGNDGRLRLWAFKKVRLPHESEPYIYIRASIPSASAVSDANTAMFGGLSVFASLFLIGLFLAWLIAKVKIVNPAMMLKRASERLAAGADTVNVSSVVKDGELGEVARSFDGMAKALSQEKSALRMSEEELRGERDRIREYLNIAGVLLMVLDREGRIKLMNRKGCETLDYKEGELIGKNWFTTCLPGRITDEMTRVFEKLIDGDLEMNGTYENPVLTKQGEERIIAWHNTVLRDEAGNITGTLSSGEDITERRQMEEELRQSRDELELRVAERTAAVTLLAAAVESAAESVLITDASWQIEYANQAFCGITGYAADEVIGKAISLLRTEEEDPAVYERNRQEALACRPYASRYKIRGKDGSAFSIESMISPVRDAAGEVRNFVVIWRDISEQVRLEEQLRQSHKMEAMAPWLVVSPTTSTTCSRSSSGTPSWPWTMHRPDRRHTA